MDNSPRYLLNGHYLRQDDQLFQSQLAACYLNSTRPRCLCVDGGIEMYVAKFKTYVIKRMPGTGEKHHPTCPSYETASGQSGLGEVWGEAVIERSPELIEVRLDFPLTRRLGKPFAQGEESAKTEISAPRKKLGLRGLLHLLWDRAGFNRWYPKMEGKRSWWVIRKHLIEAAEEIQTKGERLNQRLFVPETFKLEDASSIVRRRTNAFSLLLSPSEDVQFKMMLVVGELKECVDTLLGCKIVLKHMADCPLYFDKKSADRFRKVFAYEYETWVQEKESQHDTKALPRFRLIFAGLIYAKREDLFYIDTATLMLTGGNWVPLDYAYEQTLMDAMRDQRRRFIKPLRYESKVGAMFPNFILLDAGESPVSLDIVSPFMGDKERTAKETALRTRTDPAWIWKTMDTATPPRLPSLFVQRASDPR